MHRSQLFLASSGLLAALAAMACGGDSLTTPGNSTATLQITASTTGTEPDADGYTVTVDGVEHGTLGANATLGVDGLAAGDHVAGISGVASNCQVSGENPRTITIAPGQAASTAFSITCAAPPANAGTLRVKTATTGADLDRDGYSISVDGGKAQPIGINGTAELQNTAAGSHSVQLSGVASNCTVQGANPRSVTVSAGATAEASFAISCGATTGTIKVTTATTGTSVDADGYTVSLDGGAPQAIGVNASLSLTIIPAGSHSVTLAGLAPSCTVLDANPRSVTVAVGVETPVSFTVTCGGSGLIHWTTVPLPSDFAASAIWASSPSDLYVVARSRSAPSTDPNYVFRYDGNTWTEQFHGTNWTNSPNAIWGNSPADVFVAGERHIWHYDGTQWLVTQRELELYRGIWGSSPQDVFAVGVADASQESGLILHHDGRQWSLQGASGFSPGQIFDVAGSSPSDVYAVGVEWAPPDAPPEFNYSTSRVVHYDGNAWSTTFESKLLGPGDFSANGVWAIAPNDAFLVGSSGRILHYDGKTWSPMTSPTSESLEDVWGNSSSNVYAAGGGGILHYDGTTWTVVNDTGSRQVWGVGTDVYVVTKNGEVMRGTP